jgi:O-succinylbenzoic acid--CoA ligase
MRAAGRAADVRILSPNEHIQTDGGEGSPLESSQSLSDDQPATILFTSGSTGTPKAALHTWGNHRYSAKGANANLPLQPGDRWLLSLPLYHVGGLAILVRCALAGAAVVLSPDAPLHESLRTTDATHVSLVATQLRRLLDAKTGGPPDALRAVLLGGGPIPDSLLRRGRERGWPLLTSYGCTEMASQVTTTAPGDSLDDLSTAGRRLHHRRVRIVDDEIQVKGAPLFRGYVTDEGLDDPRTDDGWYRTGDRGCLDASGRLHVTGRIDRMFVSGGENIQPEEIEMTLEQLDAVERAVVVPVSHPEYGHRPVAFVRLRTDVDCPDFERVLRRRLPGFKIPDAFHSLPDEGDSEGLKIDRSALRERAHKLR